MKILTEQFNTIRTITLRIQSFQLWIIFRFTNLDSRINVRIFGREQN